MVSGGEVYFWPNNNLYLSTAYGEKVLSWPPPPPVAPTSRRRLAQDTPDFGLVAGPRMDVFFQVSASTASIVVRKTQQSTSPTSAQISTWCQGEAATRLTSGITG